MSARIRTHLRTNVVGYIALFLFAMSGTALALDGTNTVFDDDIVNGEVKSADIGNDSVFSADVRDGSLNAADVANNDSLGPAEIGGLTGGDIADNSITPADTTGLVGSSSVIWAVVNSDGSVARSFNGAATGSHQGTGNYEIALGAGNLDPCASLAQISKSDFSGGAPGPGEAASNQGEFDEASIDVRTYDSAGAAADRPFTVHVLCGGSGGAAPSGSGR